MKKVLKIVGGIFLLFILLGACSAIFVGEDNTPTKVADAPKEGPKEEVKEEFAIGEKIQLGDIGFTITNVEKSAGSEWEKPKSGNEFVIVTVEIENMGTTDNVSYNPLFEFEMQNSQGQITDAKLSLIDEDTNLSTGELAPGGKVSGTAVFEQPVNDPDLTFIYTPGFWSNDKIKVKLQ